MPRRARAGVPIIVLAAIAACTRSVSHPSAIDPTVSLPPAAAITAVPLGDVPGASDTAAASIRNPLEGDAGAIARGRVLYGAMNCSYCHGAQAEGLIGPPLGDGYWRYGGSAAEIYKSLYEGRPKGMPAWGRSLPPESLWAITTYLESLPGSRGGAAHGATVP